MTLAAGPTARRSFSSGRTASETLPASSAQTCGMLLVVGTHHPHVRCERRSPGCTLTNSRVTLWKLGEERLEVVVCDVPGLLTSQSARDSDQERDDDSETGHCQPCGRGHH